MFPVKKILIAEDDLDLSQSYSYWFRNLNLEILRAYDGASTLETLKNEEGIDLLILDYHLPIYDGLEVVTYMKKNDIDIPALVVSGYSEDFLKYIKFYASIEDKEVEDVLDNLKIRVIDKPIIKEEDIVEEIAKLFNRFNSSKIIRNIENIRKDIKETAKFYNKGLR